MRSTRARGRLLGRAGLALTIMVVLAACNIPLGGPANTFGNDPTRVGTQPGVWAAINGPYSAHADGDPYTTKCAVNDQTAATCDSSGANSSYNPAGYIWDVDVPSAAVGLPLTVSIYDPAFNNGDTAGDAYYQAKVAAGFDTSYQLFQTSGDPDNISTDPSLGLNSAATGPAGGNQGLGLCTGGTPGYQVYTPNNASIDAWSTLCTFTPSQAGIYPLQVRTSGIPGVTDSGGGSNDFSIRAVSSGTSQPQVYALNDLSMEASGSNGTARFYLADVGSVWAGHTMLVNVFDPGDGSAQSSPFQFQVLAPPAGAPAYVPTGGSPLGCNYSNPSVYQAGDASNFSSTCTVETEYPNSNTGIYNNAWLTIQIAIPTTYTCTSDCWWSVKYSFGTGTPTDRLVAVVNLSTATTATTTTTTAAPAIRLGG